jgi:hypothetical protein
LLCTTTDRCVGIEYVSVGITPKAETYLQAPIAGHCHGADLLSPSGVACSDYCEGICNLVIESFICNAKRPNRIICHRLFLLGQLGKGEPSSARPTADRVAGLDKICWHMVMSSPVTPSPNPVRPAGGLLSPAVSAEDRAAATELLARYAEGIDAGDFDGVAELLSDAELLDSSGNRIAQGKEEIHALYSALTLRHEDGTPCTAHVITNVIVESSGPDELKMRSRFTVFQATESLPLQAVVVGRYEDTLKRLDGEWRFATRVMIPQAWGDVSQHLSFDPR